MMHTSANKNQGGWISIRQSALLLCTTALFVAFTTHQVSSNNPPAVSHDGLQLEDSKEVAILYTDPEADFSQYDKFMMLDAYVAMKKNWQRNTRVGGRRVSNKDVERIRGEAAKLLYESFKTELEEKGGYTFVDEADDDVLILRPAVIDLVITAPDVRSAGRVDQYVASAGSATLYLELYDSVHGDILARVVDRRQMQGYGHARWANSVTNRADASRLFRGWASKLRMGMDEVRAEAGKPPMTGEIN